MGKFQLQTKILSLNLLLQYDSRSFFLFYHKHKFRKAIVWFIEWKWFERAIILIIAINSMFLPFYNYEDRNNLTRKNQIIDMAGKVFTVLFTIESVLKMIAFGFILHKNAYLRSGWNWIDFTVVLIGLLDALPNIQTANLKALRTMRVIRPLKSINSIPSMRRLISSLLGSLPALANAAAFLIFFFILFDILGVQSFVGNYYQKCRLTPLPLFELDVWPIDTTIQRLCSETLSGGGMYNCPADRYCGSPGDYNISLKNENVSNDVITNYGMMTFDNIGLGFLTLFQCITLENWSMAMYMMMDANSPWLASIFYCLFSLIGGFFLLNVILAIIMGAFEDVDNKQHEFEAKKKLEITKALEKQKERLRIEEEKEVKKLNKSKKLHPLTRNDDLDIQKYNSNDGLMNELENNQIIKDIELDLPQEKNIKLSPQEEIIIIKEIIDKEIVKDEIKEIKMSEIKPIQRSLATEFQESGASSNRKDESATFYQNIPDRAKNNRFFLFFYYVSLNSTFSSIIIFLIIANTVVLALDRYPIDQHDSDNQVILNQIFSWLFFSEMIIKLIGLGPKAYVKDTFNIFDCTVVIFSTVDIAISWAGVSFTGGAISALRSLRILRIFKLARSWTSFRNLLSKIIISIKDIANFSVLMCLFIFIYILLGMELYAYRIQFDENFNPLVGGTPARENFDYFLMGLNTVFQVIIGDNWPNFLYNYVRCTNWGAAIFFVMLFIFGNTILLNLFLAILLKNFEVEDQVHNEEHKLSSTKKLQTIFQKRILCLKVACCSCCPQKQMSIQQLKRKDIEIIACDYSEKSDNKLYNQDQTVSMNFNSNLNHFKHFDSYQKKKESSFKIKELQNDQKTVFQDEESSKYFSKNGGDSDRQSIEYGVDGTIVGQYVVESKGEAELSKFRTEQNKLTILNTNLKQNGQFKENLVLQQTPQKQISLKLNSEINESDLMFQAADNNFNKNLLMGKDMMFKSQGQFMSSQKRKENEEILQNTEEGGLKRSKTMNQEKVVSPFKLNPLAKSRIDDNMSVNSGGQSSLMKPKVSIAQKRKTELTEKKKDKSLVLVENLQGRSLFIMGSKNVFRVKCALVVGSPKFENFILFVIVLSSILLAVDNPLDNPLGRKQVVLHYFDIILTSIFTVECVLKIIVFGFVANYQTSYLKSGWNVMDITIVTISIISLAVTGIHLKFFKALRLLRILRPLRMISRNQNLKIAVQSLLNSIPGVLNVMIISLLFLILFGILGVNFFKGRLFYCYTQNVNNQLQNLIWFKWDCLNAGGEWVNQDNNFDNILNALVALFNAMSQEGWAAIMYTGTDVIDFDINPQPYYSQFNMIYFMLFMIVCNLFVLNLFVGVVINTFNQEQERLGGGLLLTPTQKEWVKLQMMTYKIKPDMLFQTSGYKFRDFCIQLAQNQWFDKIIITCIIMNTIILSLKWYDMNDNIPFVTDKLNYLFTSIFALEAIIKLIAFKAAYFKQGWNIFDFIIVIGTFVGILIGQVSNVNVGPQTTVIRAFRIGRILRIIRKYKSLRKIFNTFVLAIPSLANVGGLLFLLLFLYSILGVYLFAAVELQDNLDYHANFQNFGIALLTLIRCTTGESWNLIMFDCGRQFSILFQCTYGQSYDDMQINGIMGCGNSVASLIYFISFILIVAFIFLNMFVAIILEGFDQTGEDESMRIQEDTLIKFKAIWINYDPTGEGFIDVHKFADFILDLVEAEITIKENLIDENSKRIEKGSLLPGEHILLDLHKNQMLNMHAENRHQINPSIGASSGLSDSDIRKQFQRNMKNYIASLHLPTYKTIKFYNFYDILEELSKDLFDNDFKQRRDDEKHDLREQLLEQINSNSKMSEMQKEIEQEQLLTDFDDVISKLENKSEKEQILQYDSLKNIRKKQVNKNKSKLDTFKGNHIIDSAFVAHGTIIQQYVKNWVEKKRAKQKLRQTFSNIGLDFHFGNESQKEQVGIEKKITQQIKEDLEEEVKIANESMQFSSHDISQDKKLETEDAEQQMNAVEQEGNQLEESAKETSPIKQLQYADFEQFNNNQQQEEEPNFIQIKKGKNQKILPSNINEDSVLKLEEEILQDKNTKGQNSSTLLNNSSSTHLKHAINQNQNIKSQNQNKKISQFITDKILEASRPFTPSRIQTPALFSEETKRSIFKFNAKNQVSNIDTQLEPIQERREIQGGWGAPSTTNRDSSFKEDGANIDLGGIGIGGKNFSPINSSFDYSPQSSFTSNKDKYANKMNFQFQKDEKQQQFQQLEYDEIQKKLALQNQKSLADKYFDFTQEELQDQNFQQFIGKNKNYAVPGLTNYDINVASPIQSRSVQTRGQFLNKLPQSLAFQKEKEGLEGIEEPKQDKSKPQIKKQVTKTKKWSKIRK